MKLTAARQLALRMTVPQNVHSAATTTSDKFVFPAAFLLAGIGVGVSSFSLKQLLQRPKHS